MAGEPILIVDDNPTNLELVRLVLEMAGYQVRLALDADEALAVLHEFRPRLILMDLELPGIDGLTLTRMLKSNPSMRDIIIVGLTVHAMKGEEERIRVAGCDGFLAKPIDTRALAQVVACFLHPSPARGGA